jgi:single-strand DNA-binding protein
MNKAIIMGRLTKEVETRYTQSNTAVTKFSVAVDRRVKQGEEKKADFINCVAFGKTAEFISKYFVKGSSIAVVGRIQTGSYDNSEGKKVYTTDIMVEEVSFAGGKKAEGQQPKSDADDSGFNVNVNNNDDDLPF